MGRHPTSGLPYKDKWVELGARDDKGVLIMNPALATRKRRIWRQSNSRQPPLRKRDRQPHRRCLKWCRGRARTGEAYSEGWETTKMRRARGQREGGCETGSILRKMRCGSDRRRRGERQLGRTYGGKGGQSKCSGRESAWYEMEAARAKRWMNEKWGRAGRGA